MHKLAMVMIICLGFISAQAAETIGCSVFIDDGETPQRVDLNFVGEGEPSAAMALTDSLNGGAPVKKFEKDGYVVEIRTFAGCASECWNQRQIGLTVAGATFYNTAEADDLDSGSEVPGGYPTAAGVINGKSYAAQCFPNLSE